MSHAPAPAAASRRSGHAPIRSGGAISVAGGLPPVAASALRLLAALALVAVAWAPTEAEACGCFSPPIPGDVSDAWAVNQEAELIFFEVHPDEGTITAHVLIRYAGDPASFAWIVPVPSVPELGLSPTGAFALLDELTAPRITVRTEDLCPDPEYICRHHPACPPAPGTSDVLSFSDTTSPSDTQGGGSPVEVLHSEIIGEYDVIVFAAGDMEAAVDWLVAEGFIVNETMAPFMQPYADDGMVFVAARLVPDADLDQIRPLRMTYESVKPMIPLRLTAVGAEPELQVTAWIFGPTDYEPEGRPVVDISAEDISADASGRVNYPMVLSRRIDEVGGDGFVVEYTGPVRGAPRLNDGFCCSSNSDPCNLGGDSLCQCPGAGFDEADCAEAGDILESLALLDELAGRHERVTRITTRMSPHEMTFDPVFRPVAGPTSLESWIDLTGARYTLAGCAVDVFADDRAAYNAALARQACTTVYCGPGTCAIDASGRAGCACDPGHVARSFRDIDGLESVTCIPDENPVDHAAGGLELPDPCAGDPCGDGSCTSIGGFAACDCGGAGHTLAGVGGGGGGAGQGCVPTLERLADPGARNFSEALRDIRVCAPHPPSSCGSRGWLVPNPAIAIRGEACDREPDPDRLVPPPAPVCDGEDPGDVGGSGEATSAGGCGACSSGGGPAPLPPLAIAIGALWLALVARLRRRRESIEDT